ncbi:uncharacterized protein LOC134028605 [Osmerus eperlanus]|uniref:uncharacterized protein LOC134028605 n=1 Tax=Osmerus eperlanus TaxID=29151 RepID=UPI002E0DA324
MFFPDPSGTMEGSKLALYVFLLVLSFRRAHLSAEVTSPINKTEAPESDSTSAQHETLPSTDTPTDVTGPGCLIDPHIGVIAVASTGGLILCLMVSTLVLARQVCRLQRRVEAPRPSRSNVDLASGEGYWGRDFEEEGGVVGPCDTSVMLQEVKEDRKTVEEEGMEEDKNERENKEDEGEARPANKIKNVDSGHGETAMQMQSFSSRDSCLEVPENLENMPLVV